MIAPGSTCILLFVDQQLRPNASVEARVVHGESLEAVRLLALELLLEHPAVWRIAVLDHTGSCVLGVVGRQSPHWEMPLTVVAPQDVNH